MMYVNKKRCSLKVAVTICKAKLFQLNCLAVKIMQCHAENKSSKNNYSNVNISGHTVGV